MGMVTSERLGLASPRPGGEVMLNVTVPDAKPEYALPDGPTRTYRARKPVQGHSTC